MEVDAMDLRTVGKNPLYKAKKPSSLRIWRKCSTEFPNSGSRPYKSVRLCTSTLNPGKRGKKGLDVIRLKVALVVVVMVHSIWKR